MVEMVEEMLRLQEEHAEAEVLKEDRRHDLVRHQVEQLDAPDWLRWCMSCMR
jgi:hypothetical protein